MLSFLVGGRGLPGCFTGEASLLTHQVSCLCAQKDGEFGLLVDNCFSYRLVIKTILPSGTLPDL